MNWDSILSNENLVYSSTPDNKKLRASVVEQEYCSIKFFEALTLNEYEVVLLSLLNINGSLPEDILFHKLGCNEEDEGELQIMHRLLDGAISWGLVASFENHMINSTPLGKHCLKTGKKYKFYNGRASLYKHFSVVDEDKESIFFDYPNQIGLVSTVAKGMEIPYKEINPSYVFREEKGELVDRLCIQTAHSYYIYDAVESKYWLPESVQVEYRLYRKENIDYLAVFHGNAFSLEASELLNNPKNELFKEGKVEWCLYERLLHDESSPITYEALSPFVDLLDTKEVARLVYSGRVCWEDQRLFKQIAAISNADNWSQISQEALLETISKNLESYKDCWNWLVLSKRLPISSILSLVGKYPWLYEVVSKREDINGLELETLLINPFLRYQEWDWEALLPRIRTEFIEENIAKIEFDLFDLTRRVLEEKPQFIIDNPDRHWDWSLLSDELPIDLLACNYAHIFDYVNVQRTLIRLLSSTPEIVHDIVSSPEVLLCFERVDPTRIGFSLNQEQLLWDNDSVSFLERFGIITWHSEYYPGFEENSSLLWDEAFFDAFHSRIDSEKGFSIVSSKVTSADVVIKHPLFCWDWEALSSNSSVLLDVEFIKSHFCDLNRCTVFSCADVDTIEALASDSDIVSLLSKEEWTELSKHISRSFLNDHRSELYLWDWKAITVWAFPTMDYDKFFKPEWINKWDWDFLSTHIKWEYVVEHLSDYAYKWNWDTLVDRIPKDYLIDIDFVYDLAYAISRLEANRQKKIWGRLSSRYDYSDLKSIIQETKYSVKVHWDYSYLYNAREFNAKEYLQNPTLIQDWKAFSSSEAVSRFFGFDDKMMSRKKWREGVMSDLKNASYKWDFKGLSKVKSLIDDIIVLECYALHWDWSLVCKESRIFIGSAADQSIRKFLNRLDYSVLSEREGMAVSPELLISLEDKPWNWDAISNNSSFLLKSIKTLEALEDKEWDWSSLSRRADLDLSEFGTSELCCKEWDWNALSMRDDIVFDDDAISTLYNYPFNWLEVSRKRNFHPTVNTLSLLKDKKLDWDSISGNENLDKAAIWDNRDKLTWTRLTKNRVLDLNDVEILYKYEDYLDWTYVSKNLDKPFFTLENLRHFSRKLVWHDIMPSVTCYAPEILDEFKDVIDWTFLSKNEEIRFTSDLIRQFKQYWDWTELTRNRAVSLAMSREDSEFSHEWNVATFVRRFCDESPHNRPCIYHFTHLFNAIDIIQCRQLLSRNRMEQERRTYSDAAGSVVSRTNKAHPYARFYFRPKTPTQFFNEFLGWDSDLLVNHRSYYSSAFSMGLPKCPVPIFFEFDLQEVLSKMPDKCFYSTGNLQADASRIVKVQDDPNRLNIDYLYLESSKENNDIYKQYSQQEFLVKGEFNFGNLNSYRIICPSDSIALLLSSFLGDDPIISKIVVDESLYNYNNRKLFITNDNKEVTISTDYSDMAFFRISSGQVASLSILNTEDIIKDGNNFINMKKKVMVEKTDIPFIIEFVDPLAREKEWLLYTFRS